MFACEPKGVGCDAAIFVCVQGQWSLAVIEEVEEDNDDSDTPKSSAISETNPIKQQQK